VLEQHEPGVESASETPAGGPIEGAGWLSGSALVLVGSFREGDVQGVMASLEMGEREGLDSRFLRIGATGLLVVTQPELQLTLRAPDLDPVLADVQSILERTFAGSEAGVRSRVVDFLAKTSSAVPEPERYGLSQQLHRFREALREPLPPCVPAENPPSLLAFDWIVAVDERSFYLQGWIHDAGTKTIRLTAVTPEGSRIELLERMFRYRRADVLEALSARQPSAETKHGFVCFVELEAPSLLQEGWLLELECTNGTAVEVAGPAVVSDTIAVRNAILQDPYYPRLPKDELMTSHVHPAIGRIQSQVGARIEIEDVVQFGDPPESPEVSIVVPLYRRLDHLEMQLAEFVHDPEISEADLVYVLDSPEQADELLDQAAQLTPIYGVPFRVALLRENAGFAGANNAAASLASGRLMLLLNSDILPDRPGWLSRMREHYDSIPGIGALGPKLLYEDDSIQHAGMHFYRPPGSSVWQDAHYFKGMHRSLPAANVARPVPLVSGACLMIDRSLYERIGGLRGIYVRGDYEDSDLCLKLIEEGHENWYLPDVELYHLEGQSYSTTDRSAANRYNMWLHTRIWGDRIEALMREEG
jgi:GT2 family glycosyltransferase